MCSVFLVREGVKIPVRNAQFDKLNGTIDAFSSTSTLENRNSKSLVRVFASYDRLKEATGDPHIFFYIAQCGEDAVLASLLLENANVSRSIYGSLGSSSGDCMDVCLRGLREISVCSLCRSSFQFDATNTFITYALTAVKMHPVSPSIFEWMSG